jgi:beta-N-acetylhexosaminidase
MKAKRLLLLLWLGFIGCKTQPPVVTNPTPAPPKEVAPPKVEPKPEAVVVQPKAPALSPEDSLDLKIGQMIMVGINDRTTLPAGDPLRAELATNRMGGILIFEKNIATANAKATLTKLVADLREAAPLPLFMGIDEEGGRVHRLKEKYGFVAMPSAAYLGGMKNTDSTTFYTRRLMALLSELGFNLNFAPTVDLAVNPQNPVIVKAQRSYSADTLRLVEHVSAAIAAHDEFGIIPVLKHFPGHGSSTTDSHLGIADVTKPWKSQELYPYKALIQSGKAEAILTSHVINCRLDTSCLPASLSRTMNTNLLRDQLGFRGVLFTDDMQMRAISKHYGLEKSLKMSILSGVDVLVYGNTGNPNERVTATQLHNIIKTAVKKGEIPESRINEAYYRIRALKQQKVR